MDAVFIADVHHRACLVRQGNIPAEKALVARSKVYVVFKSVFVTEM